MAKWLNDTALDALLGVIDNGTIMTVCSAQPTNRSQAVTTYALADVSLAGGDFSIGDGTPSGRTLTVASKSGVAVDATGTATHVAICDGTNLLAVTTCTSKSIDSGDTLNVPSWTINVSDPS